MVQLTLGAAYTHKWAYGLGLSCFLLICRGLTVPVKVPVKRPMHGDARPPHIPISSKQSCPFGIA